MSTNLHRAIKAHDLDTLARLLRAGDDPNELLAEWPGWTPLDAAIDELGHGGDIEAVALLLRHGANYHLRYADYAGTSLMMAVFRGHRDAALLLLAAGADPNDNKGGGEEGTMLTSCVTEGEPKLLATLLRAGAVKTIDGVGGFGAMNPLGYAANRLEIEMIRLLIAWGASIDVTDGDHRKPRERLPDRTEENAEKWDLAFKLLSPTS